MIEFFLIYFLKGNVQRKLRWIKNSTNRWVLSPGLDAREIGESIGATLHLRIV